MRFFPLLLTSAAVLVSSAAFAQTEKGNTLIGLSAGNFSIGRSGDKFRSLSGSITPKAGYFVADNLVLGAGLHAGYARTKYDTPTYWVAMPGTSTPTQVPGYSTVNRTLTLGVSPFARYYFIGQGRHQVFGEAGLDLQRNWAQTQYRPTDAPTSTYDRQYNTFGYHAALGYNYFITSNAALEVSGGYYRNQNSSLKSSYFDAHVGFNLFLPTGKKN